MTANSFTSKQLRVTFILANANTKFPGTNSNKLILTNMRVSATVQSVARQSPSASVRIYGMTQTDMNALTVAWANFPVVLNNIITLEANGGDGWTQVFSGTIKEAQPMYRNAPDVYFEALAIILYNHKVNPVAPTSYQETVDIGLVAGDLAEKMGFAFINGGINTVLAGPLYLDGTLYDQLATACYAAKADFYFLSDTLLITPANQPRSQRPAVLLNARSGLIGYPQYTGSGLEVQAVFNPAFLCGTAIEMDSIVPGAVGRWYPNGITHTLESRVSGGKWESKLNCLKVLVS